MTQRRKLTDEELQDVESWISGEEKAESIFDVSYDVLTFLKNHCEVRGLDESKTFKVKKYIELKIKQLQNN